MKTDSVRELMSPIVALILGKLLEYLSANVDEIIAQIKEAFDGLKDDVTVQHAINDLGYDPSAENLTRLHDLVVSKGEDPQKLAKIIVNSAQV